MPQISREQIIEALVEALRPLPQAYAMWEGGAAAFGRVDEYSDIDLQVDVEDDFAEQVFPLVEAALEQLSPIETRYLLPKPTWHGHDQAFYRLRDTSPFLMIDFVVLRHSIPNKFLEREIHGEALVHFDKAGVVSSAAPVDPVAWGEKIRARREELRVQFPLFQTLTLKEIPRGNRIEAVAFYQSYTLRPLVEVLRMRYAPMHYNFHTRYLYYELPAEVVQRLEPLFFVRDVEDLRAKQKTAEAWFYGEIDRDD